MKDFSLFVAIGCFTTFNFAAGLTVNPVGQVSPNFIFNYTLQSLVPGAVAAEAHGGGGELEADPHLVLLSKGHGVAQRSGYGPGGYHSAHQRLEGVGLWTCVAAVVLISVAQLLLCYGLIWCRDPGHSDKAPPKKSEARNARPVSYLCQPTPRSMADSASNLASTSHLSVSMMGQDELSPGREPGRMSTPTGLLPLCPQLMVPDRSKLQCVLPDTVSRKRQNMIVSVCSVAARGGTPLFQARVADNDSPASTGAGIYLETLRGEEQFAFLSTREVWSCPEGREPVMDIMRATGAKYATMTKSEVGGYTITSGMGTMMVFSGQFSRHDARVCDAQGQMLAEVSPGSSDGTYEVVVFPNIDAGLVILGLLAIDKKEKIPTPAR